MTDLRLAFDHPCVWDALKASTKPIILYGMGNGADKVLDEMRRRGIPAAGVMASDDFVRHQAYRGFIVQSERELTEQLGEFTVALCFASSLPNVMKHIRSVAERHDLLVPNVPVTGSEIIDDDYICRNSERIQKAYRLLADEASKKVFQGALSFFYTGRLKYLEAIESEKEEVFRNILKLKNERYLDLGAYRGDTVDEFLHYTDGYQRITAVEPNPKNYQKLCEHIADIENAEAIHAGIADQQGVMYVAKGGGRMAALNTGTGVAVPVTMVDTLGLSPTYIKTDIEGMEGAMLRGAVKTLQEKPKLNLAAYHRTGDWFELILKLHEIAPSYEIFLRKHPYIPCWDLNIYAR